MKLSTCSVVLFGVLAAGIASGCGGADDPLGGPYGGTSNTPPPNGGNVSAVSATGGSGDDAAASNPGSSSSGGSSGSGGTVVDAGHGSSGGSSGGTGSSSGPATSSSGSSSGNTSSSGSSSGNTSSSGSGSSSGSSSSSSSGSSSGMTPAPTFSKIFSTYLARGTVGNCTRCHNQMGSASSSYSWLAGQLYINGPSSLLTAPGSCLSWYGGNMPPGGTRSDAQATSDMDAWAAAGAMNN